MSTFGQTKFDKTKKFCYNKYRKIKKLRKLRFLTNFIFLYLGEKYFKKLSLEEKDIIKLDYSLETPEERNALV